MLPLIIVAVVVVALGIFVVSIYNGLVAARERVEADWSNIDVRLLQRHDLVPNLVNTVKGYAEHETETFDRVISARNTAERLRDGGAGAGEIAQAEGLLTTQLGGLLALAEAYPQLRAVEGFTKLQDQLARLDREIADSRSVFNDSVQSYETRRQSFPAVLLAGSFGFGEKEFFTDDRAEIRQPPTVEF